MERRLIMKVVNPIGIEIETFSAAHKSIVMACMCGTWSNFSSSRTTADTCAHCGCNCYDNNGENKTTTIGNYTRASDTSRCTL